MDDFVPRGLSVDGKAGVAELFRKFPDDFSGTPQEMVQRFVLHGMRDYPLFPYVRQIMYQSAGLEWKQHSLYEAFLRELHTVPWDESYAEFILIQDLNTMAIFPSTCVHSCMLTDKALYRPLMSFISDMHFVLCGKSSLTNPGWMREVVVVNDYFQQSSSCPMKCNLVEMKCNLVETLEKVLMLRLSEHARHARQHVCVKMPRELLRFRVFVLALLDRVHENNIVIWKRSHGLFGDYGQVSYSISFVNAQSQFVDHRLPPFLNYKHRTRQMVSYLQKSHMIGFCECGPEQALLFRRYLEALQMQVVGMCTGPLASCEQEELHLTLDEVQNQLAKGLKPYCNEFFLCAVKFPLQLVMCEYMKLQDGKRHPRGALLVSVWDPRIKQMIKTTITHLDHLIPNQRRSFYLWASQWARECQQRKMLWLCMGDFNNFPETWEHPEYLDLFLYRKNPDFVCTSDEDKHQGGKGTFEESGARLDVITYSKRQFVKLSSNHQRVEMDPPNYYASDHCVVEAELRIQ